MNISVPLTLERVMCGPHWGSQLQPSTSGPWLSGCPRSWAELGSCRAWTSSAPMGRASPQTGARWHFICTFSITKANLHSYLSSPSLSRTLSSVQLWLWCGDHGDRYSWRMHGHLSLKIFSGQGATCGSSHLCNRPAGIGPLLHYLHIYSISKHRHCLCKRNAQSCFFKPHLWWILGINRPSRPLKAPSGASAEASVAYFFVSGLCFFRRSPGCNELGCHGWHPAGEFASVNADMKTMVRHLRVRRAPVWLQYIVIPNRRSTAEALQVTFIHLLGDCGSPYIVGAVRCSSLFSLCLLPGRCKLHFFVSQNINAVLTPVPVGFWCHIPF